MPDDAPDNVLKVWTCDGCQSWTDREVTEDELLNEWGWLWQADDPDDLLFCSECR